MSNGKNFAVEDSWLTEATIQNVFFKLRRGHRPAGDKPTSLLKNLKLGNEQRNAHDDDSLISTSHSFSRLGATLQNLKSGVLNGCLRLTFLFKMDIIPPKGIFDDVLPFATCITGSGSMGVLPMPGYEKAISHRIPIYSASFSDRVTYLFLMELTFFFLFQYVCAFFIFIFPRELARIL